MGKSNSRAASRKTVRKARLDQRVGSGRAFGGYTKVRRSDGTFTMKRDP